MRKTDKSCVRIRASLDYKKQLVRVALGTHVLQPNDGGGMNDPSNGYEAIAAEFIGRRGAQPGIGIGASTVRQWATMVKAGGAVLDLGCGPGYPLTQILVDAGLAVSAVDASPTMVAEFRARFPAVPIECNSAERSNYFGRKFDGVLAWGLIFLLAPAAQEQVIQKVASALTPGGQFVFTAPPNVLVWRDAMTDQRSESLGADAYRRLLEASGLIVGQETEDEGENHYYMAIKP